MEGPGASGWGEIGAGVPTPEPPGETTPPRRAATRLLATEWLSLLATVDGVAGYGIPALAGAGAASLLEKAWDSVPSTEKAAPPGLDDGRRPDRLAAGSLRPGSPASCPEGAWNETCPAQASRWSSGASQTPAGRTGTFCGATARKTDRPGLGSWWMPPLASSPELPFPLPRRWRLPPAAPDVGAGDARLRPDAGLVREAAGV
jgi:hypothetical protein